MAKSRLFDETMIKMKDVPPLLPGNPSYSTVMRWTKQPVVGVILESVWVGGIKYTTKEAVGRFIESLNTGE